MGDVMMAVHDEVFRAWPALAEAISERRADLQVRTWLRRDADAWFTTGRGQVQLVGGRLEIALDWARRNPAQVNGPVGAYLVAARRQRWRRRLLAIIAPILAVIVIVVGVLAVQANDARRNAEALRLAADARAAFDSRLDLGLLLALQARARSTDLQVQAVTLVGLTRGAGPRQYTGPGTPITSGALDQTGSHAVLAGVDGMTLWDVGQRRSVSNLPGGADSVAISADGSTVAVGRSGAVEVWRWGDGSAPRRCPTAGPPVSQVRLSPAGDRLITVAVDRGGETPTSQVATVRTSDCSELWATPVAGLVTAVDIDTLGDRLALATEDHGVIVLTASTGTHDVPTFEPADAAVRAVAFGGDEQLAGLTSSGELLQWDARLGGSGAPSIHAFDVPGTAIRYRPDGTLLAAALDGRLVAIEPSSEVPVGTPLRSLPALGYRGSVGILDIALTAAGAVTLDSSGRIVSWDLTGRPPLGPQLMAGDRIDGVMPLVDGSVLAVDGSSVSMIDGETGAVRSRTDGIKATALAARGDTFAIGTENGEVRIGSKTLEGLRTVGPQHGRPVIGVAMLPGSTLASVDDGGGLAVVAAAGDPQSIDLGVAARSMTANDGRLFVGTGDGSVRVIDPRDIGRAPVRFPGHTADVTSIAMRPDGQLLATGSDDRSIIIWDVAADGRLTMQRTLVGHTDKVTSLGFSGDGRWLASSGEDHHVMLWDVASGLEIGDPIGVSGVPAVAFAATGDRKLYVTVDGLARWDMRPESWAQTACSIVAGRTLTDIERQRYLQGDTGCSR
jgi:WD40 repeat protein